MNGILIACQIENITTRRDNTIKLTIGTNEMTPANAARLFAMINKIACVYVSDKETVPQNEIDKVDELNPEFGNKTQSQRMRNVLYKLFEQNKEGFKDFDSYYKFQTDKIIEHLKKKIDA